MKAGILTFHWAGNYGAVLQAYALQKFLKSNKVDAEDINYLPSRCIWMLRVFDVINHRFCKNMAKSMVCKRFVRKWLAVSNQSYHSYVDLKKSATKYEAFITGSDQVWNQSFLMTAEKQPTLSYYLDFVPTEKKRLSYAASFGTNTLQDEIIKYGIPALKKYDFVSVREENAVDMLYAHGVDATVVCDPTLLLDRKDYESLLSSDNKRVELFDFILRDKLESSKRTIAYLQQGAYQGKSMLKNSVKEVTEWIRLIRDCDVVVTDSFHCTVFAILFHKHFIAINDVKSGMNARINTLCGKLGLENRILDHYDPNEIDRLLADKQYDWDEVDRKRIEWAKASGEKLLKALVE